ncbi:MAG: hypothetical protein Q9168_003604 [Polycauliona sp. 1 TL-2023]
MAESEASDTELPAANANQTFERTLKGLNGKRHKVPEEFQEDFDCVSSDDGSSTQKVGRSSDLCRSASADSGSLDDSDGEYQPENVPSGHRSRRLDSREIHASPYTPDHAVVTLDDIELEEEDQEGFPDDLYDVDMEEEEEDGKPAKERGKARGKARGKKMTAKPVGIVRYHEGKELEWFDPSQNVWSYRLACGKEKLDVTAFHPAYALNGPERRHWPKILFQYSPLESDFMHSKPPIWQLHDGRVIVDCNNDAMSDYPEIPVTLARNADSWLMLTAMRKNNHITIQDFRGRMPGDRKMTMADPLGRNRISMNMTRFRKFGCCLTWNSIRANDTQREYLDGKLPRRCIRLNSTESFRKLYAWEVAESELVDAGRFLKRTRSRQKDISKARSRQVYKRKKSEYLQLKKTFERLNPSGLQDKDTEDEEFEAAASPLSAHHSVKVEAGSGSLNSRIVKPGRRRRIGLGSLQSKDIRPDDLSSPDSSADVKPHPMCPRRHQEYAGFLSRAPGNTSEAQLLYDLLLPTRVHFEQNTKTAAPETYGDECYKCQFSDLQNAMIDWHEDLVGSDERYENMVSARLIGIQYVENGELYWNTDWTEEWFGPQPMVGPDELF